MQCTIVIFYICCLFYLVQCDGITIQGVKCGVKICKLSEYCSGYDKTCQSCTNICERTHNYDEVLCEKDCQNYLHDLRFITKLPGLGSDEELRATVAKLSNIVAVNLTFVILMLVVLAGFLCFQCYRWKVKKNITLKTLKDRLFKKQSPNSAPQKTNNATMETKKTDLRIEMPSGNTNSDHSPVTMTTSISRRPAEDSALDYAYDNPAMTPGTR